MPRIDDGYGNAKTSRSRTRSPSNNNQNKGQGDGRARFAAAQAARLRADAATKAAAAQQKASMEALKAKSIKAKQANQNNNQRANLPSEVASQYAQPARTRPAVSIVSTAKTAAAPSAKIVSSPMQSISVAENAQIDTAFAAKRTPRIKTTMAKQTSGYGVNNSIVGSADTNMQANLNSTNALKVSPASTQSKSADNGSVPSYSQGNGAMSAASSPLKQAKPLLSVEPTNLPARNYGAFDNDTYQSVAKASEDSIIPSVLLSAIKNDKYRNDEVSYNQAYFAARLAGGATQAELKSEQDTIGMKKAYSGDRVITQDMKRQASDDLSRVTGSMSVTDDSKMTPEKKAALIKSGILVGDVTKTDGDAYGLFGERQDTTYDYKGGPSVVTRSNDPSLFGVNFGAKTSTTYVDGVEVATKTGRDPLGSDAKITRPSGLAKGINDRVTSGPDAAIELSNIDNQIKTETDPVKLRALHKRRLMLMRMNRTNTKFAGLLGEADTKRTNLMSIS